MKNIPSFSCKVSNKLLERFQESSLESSQQKVGKIPRKFTGKFATSLYSKNFTRKLLALLEFFMDNSCATVHGRALRSEKLRTHTQITSHRTTVTQISKHGVGHLVYIFMKQIALILDVNSIYFECPICGLHSPPLKLEAIRSRLLLQENEHGMFKHVKTHYSTVIEV